MFHILSHFKSIWLGFKSLKVGQLMFSCWCTLHIILGSPIWRAITFDQLTKILNFLLFFIVDVRDLLCFKFQLMTNLFDQFSNVIPNTVSIFLLVSAFADLLETLSVMSYFEIHYRWIQMDCTIVFSSKNTLSVSICKSWRIHLHTFPGPIHFQKNVFC